MFERLIKVYLKHQVSALPPVSDADAWRAIHRKFLPFAQEIASITPTNLDDTAVTFVSSIVEDDVKWKVYWGVVQWAVGLVVLPSEAMVTAKVEELAAAAAPEGTYQKIDWKTLIAWIMKILPIILPLVI